MKDAARTDSTRLAGFMFCPVCGPLVFARNPLAILLRPTQTAIGWPGCIGTWAIRSAGFQRYRSAGNAPGTPRGAAMHPAPPPAVRSPAAAGESARRRRRSAPAARTLGGSRGIPCGWVGGHGFQLAPRRRGWRRGGLTYPARVPNLHIRKAESGRARPRRSLLYLTHVRRRRRGSWRRARTG